ncbi:MAG: hypothetical protein ABIV42_06100 [Nitrosospira sp.]
MRAFLRLCKRTQDRGHWLTTKKRMETIDDDTVTRAMEFLEKQNKAGKPVFLRVNFIRMHFRQVWP